jgi:hypothetical protein
MKHGHFIGVVGHQLRQKGKMSKVPLGAQDFSPETSKSNMTQTSDSWSRH